MTILLLISFSMNVYLFGQLGTTSEQLEDKKVQVSEQRELLEVHEFRHLNGR